MPDNDLYFFNETEYFKQECLGPMKELIDKCKAKQIPIVIYAETARDGDETEATFQVKDSPFSGRVLKNILRIIKIEFDIPPG